MSRYKWSGQQHRMFSQDRITESHFGTSPLNSAYAALWAFRILPFNLTLPYPSWINPRHIQHPSTISQLRRNRTRASFCRRYVLCQLFMAHRSSGCTTLAQKYATYVCLANALLSTRIDRLYRFTISLSSGGSAAILSGSLLCMLSANFTFIAPRFPLADILRIQSMYDGRGSSFGRVTIRTILIVSSE